MITARSAYQVYKADQPSGTVSDYNSLSTEDGLPYRIASAEETLLASLALVEADEEQKAKYAVSVLHAAGAYVSHLISYVPLSARSQTAKKIEINYDGIVRTVMLFGTSPSLFDSVKAMVLKGAPASAVSLKELSDLEGALNSMEKEYRQRAKDAGEKVDMLRKVAPEPVTIVAATPPSQQSTDGAETSEGAEQRDGSSGAAGRRRRRSQSAEDGAGEVAVDAEGNVVAKAVKTEGDVGVAAADGGAAAAAAAKPKRAKAASRAAKGLVWGRLRGLTNNEKKAVAVLQSILQLLAHVYATKFNDLVPIFDLIEEKVKTVQAIMDTERAQYEAREDKKPPEPFHEVDLGDLRAALEAASHVFRTDEECRYELDEDLLHPLAYACLCVVNHIEGYATEPFKAPTPEDLAKKQHLRDAARAKREEARRKVLEKAEAKAELERKREEEKQLLRRRLGDDDAHDDGELEEDTTLANPSALGYVDYTTALPLDTPVLFEKALYVWSMLVSVPRALNLSQMHFGTFVKGILCEDQDANGLMEEVTKCLLEVSMEVVRVSSPGTPRIATRGKNWFEALVEFVGVASGNKKKRQQQRRREPSTEEEEEEEEEEESDEDESGEEQDEEEENSSSSSGEDSSDRSVQSSKASSQTADNTDAAPSAADGAAAPPAAEAEEEADSDPFSLELKATMENVTGLRSLATWGNVDVEDRLNLLQFCVLEALGSEDLRNEADRIQKEGEEAAANTEKRLKEVRDEAEKELRALLRTLPAVAAAAAKKKKQMKSKQGSSAKSAKSNAVKAEDDGDEDEQKDSGTAARTKDEEGTEQDPEQDALAGYEAEREAILTAVEKKRADVYAQLYGLQDGKDDGAIVEPLGMDRYRRLYWRFPLERVVYVQTVPGLTAAEFPVLPEPEEVRRHRITARPMLLDDEETTLPSSRGGRNRVQAAAAVAEEAEPTQQAWGVIPFEYLPSFVQTLDRRGKREGPLRRSLETLAPYLAQLEEAKEGRVTRSRANMFGYLNQLKVDFSY